MTRKDYILIASALRDQYAHSLDFNTSTNPQAVLEVATGVAFALAQDNPKFNREHFLAVVRADKSLTSRPGSQSHTTCQFRLGQPGMTWHCGQYTENGAKFCKRHAKVQS